MQIIGMVSPDFKLVSPDFKPEKWGPLTDFWEPDERITINNLRNFRHGSTTLPGGTNYNYNIVNITNNFNYIWMKFPGHWGVQKDLFESPWAVYPIIREPKANAPQSPKYKGIWEKLFE